MTISAATIRSFQESDKALVMDLLGELQDHEFPLQNCLLPWTSIKDEFWTWLTNNMKEKSGFMLVAEDQKKILDLVAGWMGEEDYPGLKNEERRYGYVSDLIVTASARQRGLGETLLKAAENIFLQRGVAAMRLMAFANNDLADKFYHGYGMQPYVTIYRKQLAN